MRADVLGPLVVTHRHGERLPVPPGRESRLLSLLLLRRGDTVSAPEAVAALWPVAPPATAPKSLHNVVVRLRRALRDPTRVVTERGGYRVVLDPEGLDADRFERAVLSGQRLAQQRRALEAVEVLQPALALWRGQPWTELASYDPAVADASRLEELRRLAEETVHAARLDLGEHDALVPVLQDAVRAEPLRERRWGQLMQALYRSGRQAEALDAYRTLRRTLRDELGLEPGPELRRLEHAVLTHDPVLRVTAPAARRRGLPARAPLFLGREAELAELADLLPRSRCVTLVGAGGMGKTTLASELAHRLRPEPYAWATWVDLAALPPGSEVAPAVARALGLQDASVAGVQAAAAAQPRTLLVLDNAEHVLPTTVELVQALLSDDGPALLVTSRERLRIPGERVFRTSPLRLPDDADPLASPAVQLLMAEAEAAGAASVDPMALASIARSLDGMPLALRLVAGQLTTSAPAEVAARLAEGAETEDPEHADPRHRTMLRAVLWSYDLLTQAERAGLRRLSVLVDDAPASVARAVIGEPTSESVLQRLVETSLVLVQGAADAPTFRLLGPVRQAAAGLLTDADERRAAVRAHLRAYLGLGLAWSAADEVSGFLDHGPDLRAAISEGMDAGDVALAQQVYVAAARPWLDRGRAADVVALGGRLLTEPLAPAARCVTLLAAAYGHWMLDQPEPAEALAEQGLVLAEELGDPAVRICALTVATQAMSTRMMEVRRPADTRLIERRMHTTSSLWDALPVGARAPLGVTRQQCDINQAMHLRNLGRLDEAQRHVTQALTAARAAGDPNEDIYLIAAATVAALRGQHDLAVDHYDAVLRRDARYRRPDATVLAVLGRGWAHRARGDLELALVDVKEALEAALTWQESTSIPLVLMAFGLLLTESGRDVATGVRLVAAGASMRPNIPAPPVLGGEGFHAALVRLADALGPQRYAELWCLGASGGLQGARRELAALPPGPGVPWLPASDWP